jgi:hypothetical protein
MALPRYGRYTDQDALQRAMLGEEEEPRLYRPGPNVTQGLIPPIPSLPTPYDDPARPQLGPPMRPPVQPADPVRTKALTDFRTANQGGSSEDYLRKAYTSFLGREADPEGLVAHYQNPGGVEGALGSLYDSPEGVAYRARPTPPATPPPTTGGTTYGQTLPTRGATGQLTGYPTDLGRSMKHVFGAIAARYPNDRNQLANIMQDPEFKAWFPNARQIDDDKVDFGGQLSDFEEGVPVGVVDVMRGGDDAWQWIDQNFVDGGGGGGGTAGLSPDLLMALAGLGDQGGTLEEIQRELEAVISGRPSPTNQRYLQAALTGGR